MVGGWLRWDALPATLTRAADRTRASSDSERSEGPSPIGLSRHGSVPSGRRRNAAPGSPLPTLDGDKPRRSTCELHPQCRHPERSDHLLRAAMQSCLPCFVAISFLLTGVASAQDRPSPLDQEVVRITGETASLGDYRGQVLLIVNTASACGYTPQLTGLQELQERYSDRGFTVLGFPCNDFGGQSPGTNDEIAAFCSNEYGVTFPLFETVSIRGDSPHPLYAALENESEAGVAGPVRWNFTKFLVDADGGVVARFEPAVDPLSEEVIAAIEEELQ